MSFVETSELSTHDGPQVDIPSDPTLRKQITDVVNRLVAFKIQQNAAKDELKEAVKAVAKATGVKPAEINRWAVWKFKGDTAAKEAAEKVTTSEAAFDILFNPKTI